MVFVKAFIITNKPWIRLDNKWKSKGMAKRIKVIEALSHPKSEKVVDKQMFN